MEDGGADPHAGENGLGIVFALPVRSSNLYGFMESLIPLLALTTSENWRQFVEQVQNLQAWRVGAVLLLLFVFALASKLWIQPGAHPIKNVGDLVRFAVSFALCLLFLVVVGFAGYGCWLGIKMFLGLTPVAVIGGFILFSVSAVGGMLLCALIAFWLISISEGGRGD